MTTAAERWGGALRDWAIPQRILDAAPESPYGFPVDLFKRTGDEVVAETPSIARARDALREGGTVIDVGCGGGAASYPLAPPAARIIGVDESAGMLEAFAESAPVEHQEVLGRWPDVAANLEPGDVVVCNHVLYNVWDAGEFVAALTDHARRRVVVEIFDRHPLSWMNPLWLEFHGLVRPETPRADDALALIRETGAAAEMDRWSTPARWDRQSVADYIPFLRRLLCLSADREGDLRKALEQTPPPATRDVVTIWWDTYFGLKASKGLWQALQ